MPRREPLPEPLTGHAFTLAAAHAAGIQRSRTRAGDLWTPSRGIRVPRDHGLDVAARWLPYLEATPNSWLSHTSAARVFGIPLPPWFSNEPIVHLARAFPDARPQRKGVVGHSLKMISGDTTVRNRMPTTSVCRTWLDLAGLLTLDDLIVAGDFIVSEHHRSFGPKRIPLVHSPELARYLRRQPGHRWIRKARAAYEEIRVGVDSPPETVVRLVLQRAGLPEFLVNHPIADANGTPQVWVDLGCPAFRTCIEYDGLHHLTPEQQVRDANRDQLTAELGWKQIKLNKLDVAAGPEWIEQKITSALRRQGWTGHPLPSPNGEIRWDGRRRRRQI